MVQRQGLGLLALTQSSTQVLDDLEWLSSLARSSSDGEGPLAILAKFT